MNIYFSAQPPDLASLREGAPHDRMAAKAIEAMFDLPLTRVVMDNTRADLFVSIKKIKAMNPDIPLTKENRENPANWEPAYLLELLSKRDPDVEKTFNAKFFRLSELSGFLTHRQAMLENNEEWSRKGYKEYHEVRKVLRHWLERLAAASDGDKNIMSY